MNSGTRLSIFLCILGLTWNAFSDSHGAFDSHGVFAAHSVDHSKPVPLNSSSDEEHFQRHSNTPAEDRPGNSGTRAEHFL